MGPEPAKDGRWRNWWVPSRFLAKLPYRGWSWQETNLTHKMALFLAKPLSRIMAYLRTEFVSCQLHPLYGSLARNRAVTHEFVYRPSSIVHRPLRAIGSLCAPCYTLNHAE